MEYYDIFDALIGFSDDFDRYENRNKLLCSSILLSVLIIVILTTSR